MSNKLLVVIDVQNDFVTGSLRNEEAIKKLPNVCEEVKNWDGIIVFTKDTHKKDYLDTLEGKKLPVKHCIENTWGWELCVELLNVMRDKEVKEGKQCNLVLKDTFGYKGWREYLYSHGWINFDEIEVIGYCTDICVISNVMILKSIFPNVPIKVKESCCAGVTPESHNNSLEAMKVCHIDII